MNESSVYIIERDAWSTVKRSDMHFRLTYEREFRPARLYLIRDDLNAWATHSMNALALDFGLASTPI